MRDNASVVYPYLSIPWCVESERTQELQHMNEEGDAATGRSDEGSRTVRAESGGDLPKPAVDFTRFNLE